MVVGGAQRHQISKMSSMLPGHVHKTSVDRKITRDPGTASVQRK